MAKCGSRIKKHNYLKGTIYSYKIFKGAVIVNVVPVGPMVESERCERYFRITWRAGSDK